MVGRSRAPVFRLALRQPRVWPLVVREETRVSSPRTRVAQAYQSIQAPPHTWPASVSESRTGKRAAGSAKSLFEIRNGYLC